MIQLEGDKGFGVSLLPYGATWASCRVPMRDGSVREVLLGCASEGDYRRQTSYLGAAIGRFTNRLKYGCFKLGGTDYVLERNDREHCLHGGPSGFGRRDWTIEELGLNKARLSINSSDGEGGFPGQMTAEVCYSIDASDLSVTIEFLAAVDRACPVSLTNHAYFNLDGDGMDCRAHSLRLQSRLFLPIDKDGVPEGRIENVRGTCFDFSSATTLDAAPDSHPQLRLNKGYNHAFILDDACHNMRLPAAELVSVDRSLSMAMYTTMPALHVYGGNYLPGTPSRTGKAYADYAGVALEAEFPPDCPNHPEWPTPDCIILPGGIYRHSIRFEFRPR